jgi:hypothetical protein
MYTNAAGTVVGLAWGPGASRKYPTTTLGSDGRLNVVTTNFMLYGLNNVLAALGGAEVPMTTSTPTIGTTVTVATPASFIAINGVIGSVAAETAKAFGSLGTIPQNKWGLIMLERIANGTTTFQSAADSFTTGYDSEELALAAIPAPGANEVPTGFVTISSTHASGWVTGTDALAGGTGGNPATSTNYYGFIGAADVTTGPWAKAFQIANPAGSVITSTVG